MSYEHGHPDGSDYDSALDRDQEAWRRVQPDLEIRQILGPDGARIIQRYVEAEVQRLWAKHESTRAREVVAAVAAAGAVLDEYEAAKGKPIAG